LEALFTTSLAIDPGDMPGRFQEGFSAANQITSEQQKRIISTAQTLFMLVHLELH
jgi:hypothetical protein